MGSATEQDGGPVTDTHKAGQKRRQVQPNLPVVESLGKRIARLAKEKGVAVKDLAIASGLFEGAIAKLKNGERGTTSFEAGLLMARCLGVDPYELAQLPPLVPEMESHYYVSQEDFLTLRQEFENLRLGLGLATGKVQRAVAVRDQAQATNPPKRRAQGQDRRHRKGK